MSDLARLRVLADPPPDEAVVVRSVDLAGGIADVYRPASATPDALLPAVVFVCGYPDAGFERIVGSRFKDIGATVSWARLVAASGLVAIAAANREPVPDLVALVERIRSDGAAFGVDSERIGMWASSGHAPTALWTLMSASGLRVRTAALVTPYTLDLDGSTAVADAAATFRFATPCAGSSVDDLEPGVGLFVARAGGDAMPGLNATLDRFVARALERDVALTFVNVVSAPHAFDLVHDAPETRRAVADILTFLRRRLIEP